MPNSINLTNLLGLGGGGTPVRGPAKRPAKTPATTTPSTSSTAFQTPPTIFPQYTSGAWANLPTGMLGTMPPTQPAPTAPTPSTPTPTRPGLLSPRRSFATSTLPRSIAFGLLGGGFGNLPQGMGLMDYFRQRREMR